MMKPGRLPVKRSRGRRHHGRNGGFGFPLFFTFLLNFLILFTYSYIFCPSILRFFVFGPFFSHYFCFLYIFLCFTTGSWPLRARGYSISGKINANLREEPSEKATARAPSFHLPPRGCSQGGRRHEPK